MKKIFKSRPFVASIAVMLAVLVCASGVYVSTVIAKYISEKGRDGIISSNDFDLSYQVQDPFYVSTTEALYDAIKYGYSHIKLVDTNEEWVLSETTVAALNRPMILDLNGNELVRNSPDPFLEISEGVTLTLLDTSDDQSAGLYNPVGSVLRISGGRLLVKGGKFETGPRYWEYYTYVESDGSTPNKARVDTTQWIQGERKVTTAAHTSGGAQISFLAESTETRNYPVINPTVTGTGEDKVVRGNIYFDATVKDDDGNVIFPKDTYIYYVTSDNSTGGDTTEIDVEAATFTYSYTADSANNYAYVGTDAPVGEDQVTVTIYGYEKDIAAAEVVSDPANGIVNPNYAAIQMLSGGLVVNVDVEYDAKIAYYNLSADDKPVTEPREMMGGCFINYFGVPQTSCIYQAGGELNIEQVGAFVAADPANFPTTEQGTEMLNVGESSCIVTSDDNSGVLLIQAGVYRAYNMNTVRVMSGAIHITAGIFDKFSSVTGDRPGRAAVYVNQSTTTTTTCDVTGAEFRVTSAATSPLIAAVGRFNGQNVYAMYVDGGLLKIKDSKVYLNGNYATALYTAGGDTDLTNVNMDIRGGNYLYGVFSEGGKVDVTTDETGGDHTTHNQWTFGVPDSQDDSTAAKISYAIYGRSGADINISKTDITMHGPESRGILMGGNLTSGVEGMAVIDDTNFTFSESADDGIAALISLGELRFTNSTVHMSGQRSTGVQIEGGTGITQGLGMTFDQSADKSGALKLMGGELSFCDSQILMNGYNCSALYATAGNIFSNRCSMKLTGEKAFGIYANAGNIILSKSEITIENSVQCYGMLAYALKDALKVDVADSSIVVGGTRGTDGAFSAWNDTRGDSTSDARHSASMGLFMINMDEDTPCYISLTDTDIHAVDMGVGVRKGYLFLQGSSTIESKNASVLSVSGGDVFVGNMADEYRAPDFEISGYTISKAIDIDKFHALNPTGDDPDGIVAQRGVISDAGGAVKLVSTMGVVGDAGNVSRIDSDNSTYSTSILKKYFQSPDPTADDPSNEKAFDFVDGVYVSGGNLLAKTKLELTFTGFHNRPMSDGDYSKVYENSFALHVVNGSVRLYRADITNSIGGGVGVRGGNVYLGSEESSFGDVTVTTTGTEAGSLYHPATVFGAIHGSWQQYRNYTGGTGIVVTDGNLDVYNAKVTTEFGSAMVVNNYDEVDVSLVKIHGGYYIGNSVDPDNIVISGKSGPGALYGLKVYGGAEVHIYGGDFGGGNGGAFFTGTLYQYDRETDTRMEQLKSTANVYVYEGRFGYTGGMPACYDGFNVYEGSNLVLGAYGRDEIPEGLDLSTAIQIRGNNACIAVNPLNGDYHESNNGYSSEVSVYYGSYEDGSIGALYLKEDGGATVDVYNYYSSTNTDEYERYIDIFVSDNIGNSVEDPYNDKNKYVTFVDMEGSYKYYPET